MFQPLNPKPYLASLTNTRVVVRLKHSPVEYAGTLLATDNYMNLLLATDTLEYPQGPKAAGVPLNNELFLRCNNVMWVAPAEQAEPSANTAAVSE